MTSPLFNTLFLLLAGWSWMTAAMALELKPQQVTEGVYALVGETGPRTRENLALNSTMGFVVTSDGVAVIDSGATPGGARLIEQAVKQVTDQPVRWVINTGSQDHRWLGNGYFRAKGAKIIALKRTVETQKRFAESHLARLEGLLKEQAEEITPVYASPPLESDHARFRLGDTRFELIWFGDAHFPGDAVVWLPEKKIVFTGDMVYVERMLGIQEISPVLQWQQAFHAMERLDPEHVIPGHGSPCDLEKARRETGDYLDWLVTRVSAALDEWKELDETVDELTDAPRFKQLQHYDSWHRKNINRTYLQLEAER